MKLSTITLLSLVALTTAQPFLDVTPPTFYPPALKFGGAAVADLDGNGYPDLILGYHGSAPVQVYFNFRGQFNLSSFKLGGDMHAYAPFRASPSDRGMQFTVSRGGRKGNFPRSPVMFRVNPFTHEFINVTDRSGITTKTGRGRSALYVDMSLNPRRSFPDVIYTNSNIDGCPSCIPPQNHVFKNIGGGIFRERFLDGISNTKNSEGIGTDIDGDGRMEIIMFFPGIEIYKVIAPMKVRDITREVLPASVVDANAVNAVSELDYDNDGDFDLYIARGKTGPRSDLSRGQIGDDILLENRNGVFVDVSERAKIPKGTFSYGLTSADFDNDGFMDIFVTMYNQKDLLLHNNGNGTFTTVKNTIPRPSNSRGDMAQAVDYDSDGRVDLIVSQGERVDRSLLGRYRVFRNTHQGSNRRGYVLVRVGSSPQRRAVSLHAVVTVRGGRKTWVRRVGSPGTAFVSSYIELVHVGIGATEMVDLTVRWVNGEEQTVRNVSRGSKIKVGAFGRDPARRSRRGGRRNNNV